MNLNELQELLKQSGFPEANLYAQKNRIYLSNSKQFVEYVQQEEECYAIKVFLKNKEFGVTYTKAEWRECFQRRDEIFQQLNELNLSVKFIE